MLMSSAVGCIRISELLSRKPSRHLGRTVSPLPTPLSHNPVPTRILSRAPPRSQGKQVLTTRMNWLDPPVEPPNLPEPQDQEAPSENNLNYWAARLLPLHDPTPGYSTPTPERNVDLGGEEKEVVFVTCNRVGTEEGMSYINQR
jgi:hypothetical protein